MPLPSPRDLGFPEKFERWRPSQETALSKLLTSARRVKAVAAPTGFGKSPVAVAYALITNRPTCFVTDSRGLQDQYMADFASVGMVDLRGRRNYDCLARDSWSCEEGHASRCPYKGTAACPSSKAEMTAATSRLVVTNYAKWTTNRLYGQGMEHFEQVVFDEGHKTPEAIGQAMHIELHAHEIESVLGIPFLGGSAASEMTDWKQWAVLARAEAENRIVALRAKMRDSAAAVKQLLHMRNLSKRLATLATARPEHWVCDEMSDGYVFDPVRVGRYGESMLLLGIPSIVIVSATLRPKTMFMIGLGKDHFDYLEFDSDFDPHRCPIYYLPTMRVDHRASSLAPLWIKLDQIAARRTDRKGIVHTISFTRRNEILSVSRFAPAMLVNERGEASTQAIAAFKAAGPGTILVSPSVAEGFDFPGRDCEWQFVAKIPFPDGRAKIVKARQEDDKEWGAYQAFNKLVQIFGRGMRHREDRCESFICDTHLDWFLPKFGHLAPRTFHNFFRRIGSLPPPAPKL